jgi:HK97 gp10 family phage protein
MADLKWYGGRRSWEVRAAIAETMEKIAAHIVRKIKADLNTPYPPASVAGEAPHRRTGNLRASVDYWINRKTLEVNIGVNIDAPYWEYLEFGTVNMASRPFLRTTIGYNAMSAQRKIEKEAAKATRKYMGKK